ncbi:hypothetical protein PSTG_12753 [Puccinia striiformis f. sp. tritici PST-78]|uniref:Uncharacterized protein n=1 Tax=Puccinia striiformis f. sp. tritici PST-78 TaxID=1165861 RepID=A0A0L0V4T0_9BASI|nr:hypothetical protein PSTG_12753 [Puccinia striiformis f. sp. tritici PST-78]
MRVHDKYGCSGGWNQYFFGIWPEKIKIQKQTGKKIKNQILEIVGGHGGSGAPYLPGCLIKLISIDRRKENAVQHGKDADCITQLEESVIKLALKNKPVDHPVRKEPTRPEPGCLDLQ